MIDPRYVRWIITMAGYRDSEPFEHILPVHKCTDEDYAEFYPINPGFESLMRDIREDPDRGFICLDWNDEDPFKIFGDIENSSEMMVMEAILAPCNYVHNKVNQTGLPISD